MFSEQYKVTTDHSPESFFIGFGFKRNPFVVPVVPSVSAAANSFAAGKRMVFRKTTDDILINDQSGMGAFMPVNLSAAFDGKMAERKLSVNEVLWSISCPPPKGWKNVP